MTSAWNFHASRADDVIQKFKEATCKFVANKNAILYKKYGSFKLHNTTIFMIIIVTFIL